MVVPLAAEDHVVALLGERTVPAETAEKAQQPVRHLMVAREAVPMDH